MCYFLFYFFLQFWHDTQCYSDDGHVFTSQIFDGNGNTILPFPSFNQESLWIRLSSNKNSSEIFWLKLKPKRIHYIPLLIKDERNAKMDRGSGDCLFSAASALIPLPLASINSSNDKQFQQQIQIVSTKAMKYEPTEFLTVSLCHGISGIVQLFNSTSFVFLQPNSSFVHLQKISTTFFHEKKTSADPLHRELFDIADFAASRLKRVKRSSFHMPVRLKQPGPFLVELYIIVDSKTASYNAYDNYKPLISRISSIINLMNMAFSQFNIYFTVVQLEIWEHDQMKLTDKNHILIDLQQYKRRYITKQHDCLHAILGENLMSSRRGQSELGSMCGYNTCVGYTKDYADQNEMALSHSVLHEIGHNFGLHHDTEQCQCYDCIMATGVEFASTSLRWSNCSMKEMSSLLNSGIADCLRDRPITNLNELNPIVMKPNQVVTSLKAQSLVICGNGVVDEGEQCDCGYGRCPPEFAHCCNPDTCQFRSGASCAGGTCCDLNSCSIRSSGTICRSPKGNTCDLPEYCDGKTEWCPADVYKEDSTECTTSITGKSAFCYRGTCHTRQSWCQVLWGNTAHEANYYCYMMNKKGDLVKNCGLEIPSQIYRDRQPRNWNTRKCTDENAKCGRLWCSHQNERVLRPSGMTVPPVDEMIRNHHCSAVRFDMDFFMYDAGMVPNGAPCNYGKMCWHGDCISPSSLKIAKCYCNGHGVCNNNKNCHCDSGFAAPNCTNSGDGGSVDSGPPGKFHSTFRTVIAAIIITLVVILSVLLIASFVYHYRTRSWPMILTWIKCPTYRPSKLDTGKKDMKYAQVKHNYILNVDINSAGQKIHISPMQSPRSPKSPSGSGKKEAFNRIKSFFEVKQPAAKEQSLLNSENQPCEKPIITVPKPKPSVPEALECSKIASKPQPEALENRANKPIPKVFSIAKPPPILAEKPVKLAEPVPPPVSKEKPGRLHGVLQETESKPDKSVPHKISNTWTMRQELCAKPNSDKRPSTSGDKPKKPGITVGPPPLVKPDKPYQGGNFKPALKQLSGLDKVPPVIFQKTDLKLNPKSIVKDSQALPNLPVQNKPTFSKPVAEKTVPNKISGSKMETLNKKLESVISKSQISQPKLEHTSNPSVVPSAPEKRTTTLSKPSALQTGSTNPRIPPPSGIEKPPKPVEIEHAVEKPAKLSKLQISQPRLNQTTCTDGTVNLPTIDRTLTRTVKPHKILQCDPSKTGKYL